MTVHSVHLVPFVTGAQWTGIVTSIAMEMLRSNIVDAVVCVQRFVTILDQKGSGFGGLRNTNSWRRAL